MTDRPVANAAAAPRWALASLALSMLLSSLGISIANVALPTLAQAFAAPFQQVQWVVLAYLLAITITSVSVGRLGDLIGRRRVLIGGIALFTAASILCGAAPSLWLLILARALQGLGAAVLMALTVALVGETVPKARTGSAMGQLGTMSAIGTALGPSLGGVLIAGAGWRAIFLVMAPLGVLNLLLAGRALPGRVPGTGQTRTRFDSLGTLVLGLTLLAYTLAMTIGRGRFGTLNAALLVAALFGIGAFVLAERRAAQPLIRLAQFRNAALSASLAMSALVGTVMMATLVVGPFYLSRALGLDQMLVGLVLAIGPLISTLSGVPAGRLVDRLGARFMIMVGLTQMAIGAFALSVFPASAFPAAAGIAGYVAAILILTPGYQLFQASNNTLVMADIGPEVRGVISGMLSLARNLGLITGASVMGAVFTAAVGSGDIAAASPSAVGFGMRTTFAVAAALIVLALVIAAARARAPADALLDNRLLDNQP